MDTQYDQRSVNFLTKQLALRKPQQASLQILAEVLMQVGLSKTPDLDQWLNVIRQKYSSVKGFEREFPSLCFALATGVGKTRLMGAMIAWLYLTGRSRHFMVLAPNLTIYDKLKQDFSLASPKYVFKGIQEFAQHPPVIITGEDYEDGRGVRLEYAVAQSQTGDLFGWQDAVHINIFNISKINARDNKKGAAKSSVARMRRLQEYIGDSYFNYLAELPDLVVLMDEAHRYYASAGAQAINDLKPILGLELTATPKTVGAKPRDFSNIIYHYPLASALKDGYIKIPAVATREDFNPKNYSAEQLERIKLEDGIHHHEYVKVELQTYAYQQQSQAINPFVLVVAQDTQHARQLKGFMESEGFFEGRYQGKVIEVHSNQSGEESDEAMQRLLAVEHDANTEIVIHVNKLKEGWDVTNLYTIVPLRASASEILTEQTLGRGLRLPFGKRTGVEAIDRLTIIAHDRFQEILERAKDGESIIQKTVYIGGSDKDSIPDKKPQAVEAPSIIEQKISGQSITIDGKAIKDSAAADYKVVATTPQAQVIAATTQKIIKQQASRLGSSAALINPSIQADIVKQVKQELAPQQGDLLTQIASQERETEIETIVKGVTEVVAQYTLDIPRIVILPTREVNYGFQDFDLQGLEQLNYQPVSQTILLKHLEGEQKKDQIHLSANQVREDRMEDYIVRQLMDKNEIDYDAHADLLYKLSGQLVNALSKRWADSEIVENILVFYQKQIAEWIWAQMRQHLWSTPTDYQAKVTQGFDLLEPNHFTKAPDESIIDFKQSFTDKQRVRKYVFTGFKRCCYPLQKFQSVDGELALARVLDEDDSVLKWMKPAAGKFRIEYQSGLRYEPDFVVETKDSYLLLEPKNTNELGHSEVQAKKNAAERWCHYASEYAQQVGAKPWYYALIPHNEILANSSLKGLLDKFASCLSTNSVHN